MPCFIVDSSASVVFGVALSRALSWQSMAHRCSRFCKNTCSIYMYHIHPMNWDGQARANSVDPDQMPQNVASDLDLHCLPLTQQFLGMSTGSKLAQLFKASLA